MSVSAGRRQQRRLWGFHFSPNLHRRAAVKHNKDKPAVCYTFDKTTSDRKNITIVAASLSWPLHGRLQELNHRQGFVAIWWFVLLFTPRFCNIMWTRPFFFFKQSLRTSQFQVRSNNSRNFNKRPVHFPKYRGFISSRKEPRESTRQNVWAPRSLVRGATLAVHRRPVVCSNVQRCLNSCQCQSKTLTREVEEIFFTEKSLHCYFLFFLYCENATQFW